MSKILLLIFFIINSSFAINLGNFTVYSTDKTVLQERVRIRAGDVGSAGPIEIRCDDSLYGNLLSGNNILLRERAIISGDAIANGSITLLSNAVVQGTKTSNAQTVFPVLPQSVVVPGIQNITVPAEGIYTLNPGNYNDFHVYHRSTLIIKPGIYNFNKFIIESDTRVMLDIGSGTSININVKDLMKISDRIFMQFSGIVYPYSISFYSSQTSPLILGCDDSLYGIVTAPNATLTLQSRTKLMGALLGKQVVVESEATICKSPALSNLTHSELVMGPPFDPLRVSYQIVLPTATNTILISPTGNLGQIVTVDGQDPGSLINLNNAQQKIIVLLNDPKYCGATEYTLDVTRTNQFQIFVNADSPCTPELEDGKSWATAFKDLQRAVDSASVSGREIWVAEGTYKPTKKAIATDPRSATFLLQAGTKIIGGFLGSEADNNPEGDVQKTILSGDIVGNDSMIAAWPPGSNQMSPLSDNAYHVVTLSGISSMENLCIEGGYANGSITDGGNGAGVLDKSDKSSVIGCVIQHNIATSSGAGFYDPNGTSLFEDCVFKQNISVSGSGSGLYLGTDSTKIISSIFDGNVCQDTTSGRGGALYNARGNVKMQTSVFTRNSSAGNGGAILTKGGNMLMDNCTIAYNTALKEGSGIASYASATVDACNSIFWDVGAVAELYGSGYTVSYSDIRGSYPGINNDSLYPLFSNPSCPEGPDGVYGSKDDGLQILSGSPCKEEGNNSRMPEYDIRLIPLSYGETVCMGAYEFEEYAQNQAQRGPLGYLLKTGEFESLSKIDIIDYIYNWKEAGIYAHSNYARVLQIIIPKNKYTKNTDMLVTVVRGLDTNGQPLSGSVDVRIPLIRVGSFASSYCYQSKTLTWGKPIIFCSDPILQNWNDSAYIIYSKGSDLSYKIPKEYFRK